MSVTVADTHYVPFYTRQRGRGAYLEERTVCGKWIAPTEHTVEPTCLECQRWLEQDAIDTIAITESWGER